MGALMAFRVGQEVVCIFDGFWGLNMFGEIMPVKNQTYTIREIVIDDDGDSCFRFNEIINRVHRYKQGVVECSFWSARFRPIVKTDISIFTAMLAPSTKQRVDADA